MNTTVKKHHQERPLGFRERAMLCDRLWTYARAKEHLQSLQLEREHYKRALHQLFVTTGGHKWLHPQQVEKIVREVL